MIQYTDFRSTMKLCLFSSSTRNPKRNSSVGCILVGVISCLIHTGCQSSGFRAGQLPTQYRAAGQNHSKNINLANFAVPGSSESLIATSDLLKITVATGREEDPAEPFMARVADDGTVDVPIIGPAPVAGMEVFEASQNIVNLAIQRGMYRHPLVTVEIESKAVNRVTVLGAITEPGVHEIPRGNCDLVSALAASGGLTEEAGTVIEIVRQPQFGRVSSSSTAAVSTGTAGEEIQLTAYQKSKNDPQPGGWSAPRTFRFDLAGGQLPPGADFRLLDRDVIRVIPRKKEVIHVAGLVNEAGQFELPTDEEVHLLDAIALAKGRSSPVADKVLIIRQLENQTEPLIIQASLSRAKVDPLENLRLASGDSISVEQTPVTAVVDTFARFFRLTFGVASSTIF